MTILRNLGVTEKLYSFGLVLKRKTSKEIPKLSRLDFLDKFSTNNFSLLEAEVNTSEPLINGGMVDLPLMKTLLEVRLKSREFSFIDINTSRNLLK